MRLSAASAAVAKTHPGCLVLHEPAADLLVALRRTRAWLSRSDAGPEAHVLLIGAPSAAIAQLARSLAAELGPSGCRANALAIGPAATHEDVLDAAGFLLSDEASYVTGVTVALGES